MSDFASSARPLDESELAEITGGHSADYNWAEYDWRDAVMCALP
ncbi:MULTISPECIES: hypothetical protein [Herbidospora]|nr:MULTISPECIES: hypothetical protein [Herbidospora]